MRECGAAIHGCGGGGERRARLAAGDRDGQAEPHGAASQLDHQRTAEEAQVPPEPEARLPRGGRAGARAAQGRVRAAGEAAAADLALAPAAEAPAQGRRVRQLRPVQRDRAGVRAVPSAAGVGRHESLAGGPLRGSQQHGGLPAAA